MSIQDVLYFQACEVRGCRFHVNALRLRLAFRGLFLSYKQARDALYRLRVMGAAFIHLGRGWYRWVW